MYKDWDFKSNKEKQLTSLEELSDFVAEQRNFDSKAHEVQTLDVKEGKLFIGEEQHVMTKSAFKDFCRLLGIPDPFAKRISDDLLQYNIDNLKYRLSGEYVSLLTDPSDGGIVRINQTPFLGSPVQDITTRLKAMSLDPVWIKADLDRIDVALVNNEVGEILAEKGDPSKVAIRLRMSDTTAKPITARAGLYRMVCSNGTLLGNDFGSIRTRIKAERDPQLILNTFFEQLNGMEMRMDKISDGLTSMVKTDLNDREAYAIWKKVSKSTDQETADLCLNIDAAQRTALKAGVKARDHQVALGTFRTNNFDISDQPFTLNGDTVSVYDVYNNITNRAKNYPLPEQMKMESIGGSLFDLDSIKKAA